MRRAAGLFTLIVVLFTGCKKEVEPAINYDFKVQAFYVVPTNKNTSEDNILRVARSVIEMQRWFQTATGGLTFEFVNDNELVYVYYARRPDTYYEGNWWNLLLDELEPTTLPVGKEGTIALFWVEGMTQVDESATARGGISCGGNCGIAMMPMHTLIAQTTPPVDMGLPLHELGHALGLEHPLDEEDLPLPPEANAMLYSVMNQSSIRAGTNNVQHGLLTFEKAALSANPFMKEIVLYNQDLWRTNILNYPVTGAVPEPEIIAEQAGARTVKFSTNISDALRYYWIFGDGTTSYEAEPEHVFEANGFYNVTLMVTSPQQMAGRTSVFVDVQ